MRKVLWAISMLVGLTVAPSLAEACLKTVYIDRLLVQPGTTAGQLIVREVTTSGTYFLASTADDKLMAAASAATLARARVMVKGSASVCPTTAGGNMGTVQYIVLSP